MINICHKWCANVEKWLVPNIHSKLDNGRRRSSRICQILILTRNYYCRPSPMCVSHRNLCCDEQSTTAVGDKENGRHKTFCRLINVCFFIRCDCCLGRAESKNKWSKEVGHLGPIIKTAASNIGNMGVEW